MTMAVDAGLDFFRQALALRGYRQEILTADIANASTPGFKAVDLDFRQALSAADTPEAAPALLVDDPRQLSAGAGAPPGATAAVKYQAGGAVTLDGNSVDLGREKVEAAENAVEYEAAASFTSQIVKMLATAINGAAAAGGGGS